MRDTIWHRTARSSFRALNPGGRAFCLACCLIFCHLPAPAQTTVVAHVLDVKGTWRIDGQASPVVHGQAVSKGAKVIAVSNHPGDSISLVHESDLSRQQILCDASPVNPCSAPTVIDPASNSAAKTTSQVASLVHSAFALLMGTGPATASQYAVTMTRAVPSEKFQEAVVPLSNDGTIVLPHSPGGIPVGAYTLRITHADSQKSTPTQENAVLEHGGVWRPVPFPSPGLFHITIRDTQDHAIANTMLLVVPQDQSSAKQKSFEEAKTLADAWTGPNARTEEHEFLRALLLSESSAK